MEIHVYPSEIELIHALGEWIEKLIEATLARKEQFTFCLSGGNTPKALYHLLASRYDEKIDCKRVHFFWGDERFVPYDDKRNNARMAFEAMIGPLNIPAGHVHKIDTSASPQVAAENYSKLLYSYFAGQPFSFDLVLNGLGEDGHTLSLFPGNNNNFEGFVSDVQGPDSTRITLGPEIVNKANAIVFMVTGDAKASVLNEVINGNFQPEKYPSQLIKPANENLHWFIDAHAAKALER